MTAGKQRRPGWGPGDERRLEELLAVRMRRRLYPQEQAEYEHLSRARLADARRMIDLRRFERVRV
jgi:hypothetical protein